MEVDLQYCNDIRCMNCDAVLSLFPIYSIDSIEEAKYICGRCPLPADRNPKRQSAFESLAQYLKFNCIYFDNGCVEKMLPAELKLHEPSCPKRQYNCPIYEKCVWDGLEDEILEHVYADHNKFYLDEYEGINLNLKDINQNYVLEYLNHAFLIILSSDETYAYFQVKLWGPRNLAANFNYNFTLCNDHGDKDGMDFPKLKVDSEDGLTNVDIKSAFKIELATLESLHPEKLSCQFSVGKEEVLMKKDGVQVSPLNKCILDHLQCPICFEHMVTPIFQCGNGHVLCNNCKDSIKNCPSCQMELGTQRNRILEDITQHILYECKYDGCQHKFYAKDKADHETKCAYSEYKCFMNNCKWSSDYATILHHFNERHYELVKQNNFFHAFNDDEKVFNFILKYDINTFIIFHKYSKDTLYVRVEFFGPKNKGNEFYYAVTVDAFNSKDKIYMRKSCYNLSQQFNIEEDALIIPVKFIKQEENFCIGYRLEIVE